MSWKGSSCTGGCFAEANARHGECTVKAQGQGYYSWRPVIKTCSSNGGETCGLHSPRLGCGATDTH